MIIFVVIVGLEQFQLKIILMNAKNVLKNMDQMKIIQNVNYVLMELILMQLEVVVFYAMEDIQIMKDQLIV